MNPRITRAIKGAIRGLPRAARPAVALAAALPLSLPLMLPSAALAQSGVSSHRISTPGGAAQRINMSIGKSVIIDLPRDAKEVFVANPKVANAVVRSARKLFIIGAADGATSIFAMDADGNQIATLDITVGRDLNVLRQTLKTAMPSAEIEVKPAGDSILLVGHVQNASDASQAMDIAKAFVGVAGGGGATGAVINSLTIKGRDQVLLKVTIAEVSRSALKQIGVNATGNWNIGNVAVGALSSNPVNAAVSGINAATNNGSIDIRALERAGASRTLAEPTLTAISGESAKFTAGGELPVPSSRSCTPDLLGRLSCVTTIEFKPFGVTLNFTPIVLSEGRISMRIATEVTEINTDQREDLGSGLTVSGFRVRKADTTVEVPSGGSMMTAGLIQQNTRQGVAGLPGLINLPVIGALFRSREYQRQETELLIIVTPYLARAVSGSQLARPDDGFVDSHDAQAILLGRLNKIYGAGSPGAAHGYRGRVGFIAD